MVKYIIAKNTQNILNITQYVLNKFRKLKPKPKPYPTRHLSVFDCLPIYYLLIHD